MDSYSRQPFRSGFFFTQNNSLDIWYTRSNFSAAYINSLQNSAIFKKHLFYLWLCWVFVAMQALLQLGPAGATLQVPCAGFLLWWLLLLWSTGSRTCVGSAAVTPRLQSTGSVVVAQGLSCSADVGSSQTTGQILVSCTSRQVLYHGTTREAQKPTIF